MPVGEPRRVERADEGEERLDVRDGERVREPLDLDVGEDARSSCVAGRLEAEAPRDSRSRSRSPCVEQLAQLAEVVVADHRRAPGCRPDGGRATARAARAAGPGRGRACGSATAASNDSSSNGSSCTSATAYVARSPSASRAALDHPRRQVGQRQPPAVGDALDVLAPDASRRRSRPRATSASVPKVVAREDPVAASAADSSRSASWQLDPRAEVLGRPVLLLEQVRGIGPPVGQLCGRRALAAVAVLEPDDVVELRRRDLEDRRVLERA